MADLKVNICGVELKNPVIAASGTFGFGKEFNEIYDISCLGGISTKGLTLEPRAGNPTPRIAEGDSVILNAVGLQNPGVDVFLRADLAFLRGGNDDEHGCAVQRIGVFVARRLGNCLPYALQNLFVRDHREVQRVKAVHSDGRVQRRVQNVSDRRFRDGAVHKIARGDARLQNFRKLHNVLLY